MNQHLAKAIEIYGDNLQQLLAWHLCHGVVYSDFNGFSMYFFCDHKSPMEACQFENSNTLFVTIHCGMMTKNSLTTIKDKFKYIAFQRDTKNSPRIRIYNMSKFYSKLK